MSDLTHYEILGVPDDAPAAQIRKGYVARARQHHPDFHTNDRPDDRRRSEAMMRRINEAWLVLGDPGARATYDQSLRPDRTTVTPEQRPVWRSASGGAHPDFVPFDGDPETGERSTAAFDTWWVDHDDTPVPGARTMPAWQQLSPPALLLAALACLGVGVIVNLMPLVGLGLMLLIFSGLAFMLIPMLAVMRSNTNEHRSQALGETKGRPRSGR